MEGRTETWNSQNKALIQQAKTNKETQRVRQEFEIKAKSLRKLGGVVLVDMVKTLESWEEEIPRRNLGRIVISRTRGDDGNRTRDLEFHQERNRLSNRNPRNQRR
jgi:hypothetical protein